MTIDSGPRPRDRADEQHEPAIRSAIRPAIRSDLWPDLAVVPTGPRAAVSAAVARRLFTAAVRRLPVSVVVEQAASTTSAASAAPATGSRQVLGQGGPTMTIHRPDEFFARLGRHGLIGFGEAYLTRAWDADDLGGFLTVLAADLPTLVPPALQQARALVVARRPRSHRATTANSRSNIAHHYDLSNDLFASFLDESLCYSSALFDTSLLEQDSHVGELHLLATPPPATDSAPRESLVSAQARKTERLLDRIGVRQGTRLLEIGTGWGELAIRAARRGAVVRTVTLSRAQLELARRRIADAGFADRVEVELRDYRTIEERAAYDAVASVEMVEAVGHEFWPDYFAMLDRVLAPNGKVGLQAIVMPHDRMLATRTTHTWITKYVFPGGTLPSVQAITHAVRAHTSLRVSERLSFGSHYAETLRRWDQAFRDASERVRELGFDPTFERMWHFYLEYSRAGFASGYLDVEQMVLER
jgi:cyclopropane-fatty-acyl-phospholipid synthase